MLYLGCGRTELPLRALSDAGLMLLGGEPFEEEIVMFWNFIGRSHEEIAQAREDWMTGSRFGDVKGYDGGRLSGSGAPAGGTEAAGEGALIRALS
ncbi:Pirin family protein OS=Streptomyces microflavus OX=1919 GN=HUT09_32145 PE=3 SV=1 [Streptomyces microflavus]